MTALDHVEWEAPLLEPLENPDAEREVRKIMSVVPGRASSGSRSS